ncbi:DNA ligase D [Bacillus sp. SB49]|nr:DNA ligase D [Bacillus sp. SB49]
MKPMLLTAAEDLPTGPDWIYEVKYDGFRCLLHASEDGIKLWSRNGKDLSGRFPEICGFIPPADSLPFTIDGELVIRNTRWQTNFSRLQTRGRLKKEAVIARAARERPCTFVAFDHLTGGKQRLEERKRSLYALVQTIQHPHIVLSEVHTSLEKIKALVLLHRAEGIVAKHKKSLYSEGERSKQWLKWKNFRSVSGCLTAYDPANGYYDVTLMEETLGKFKNGLSAEEAETLQMFFKSNGEKQAGKWYVRPSVCADIHCLDAADGEMREPTFHRFRFDLTPENCTKEKMEWDLSLYPEEVPVTNSDKQLWKNVSKKQYFQYIRHIAPYMLPFLAEKKLTVIRCPDGITAESFYQKQAPDHAPDYLDTWEEKDGSRILCNNLPSLLWLANQGAVEFHIPFDKTDASLPDEIVFDLDPPSRKHFSLAITAAQWMKQMLDEIGVISFIKTSGNKGMQIHIPIQAGDFSYEETRNLTEAVAETLVQKCPDLFTVERLKKKRGEKLYLDYVQHAEGKTIVAPYSARRIDEATVACPLFWEEVKEGLRPESFTIKNVLARLEERGCPFLQYEEARKRQPVKQLKRLL